MSYHVGSPRARKAFFHPRRWAIISGLFVFAFLVFADQLSIHYGLKGSQLVLDDLCGAIIAGLLVYRHEYNRSKYLSEKLKTIELMNHHVRNALQVVVDSVYLRGHAQQLAEIQDSVKRIDWALREILTGRVLDEYKDPGNPETNETSGRSAA
jgi:hypothetical protein